MRIEAEPRRDAPALARSQVDELAYRKIQESMLARIRERKVDLAQRAQPPRWARTILRRDGEMSVKTLRHYAEEAEKRVGDNSFLERLKRWEPWRLNESSVQRGKNLEVGMTKAYAGIEFMDWIYGIAQSSGISRDEVLATLIQDIRRVEWETKKLLLAVDQTEDDNMPLNVVSNIPRADLIILAETQEAIKKQARGAKDTSGLFFREAGLAHSNWLQILLMERDHLSRRRSGGPNTLAATIDQKNFIAFDAKTLIEVFTRVQLRDKTLLHGLVGLIVHETMHHSNVPTDRHLMEMKAQTSSPGLVGDLDVGARLEKLSGFEDSAILMARHLLEYWEPEELFAATLKLIKNSPVTSPAER